MHLNTFALLAAVLVAAPAHAADLYRWVDETGRIHYSDAVPDKFKSKASKVEGGVTVLSSSQMRAAELPSTPPPKPAAVRKQTVAGEKADTAQ